MNQTILIHLSETELSQLIESSLSKFFISNTPPTNSVDDVLLNLKEAAKLINYKESSMYGLVKRKKIPFIKIEGKLLFSKNELLQWIATKSNKMAIKKEVENEN